MISDDDIGQAAKSKDSALSKDRLRAIFLDFDGVLHPPRAIAGAKPPLTPQQVMQGWPETFQHLPVLAEILQGHPDIVVVVSSSWRMYLTDAQLGELLEPIRAWYAGSIGSAHLGRDIAITNWLNLNNISDFVVLDDVQLFFPGKWPTLILCESSTGISDIHVQSRLRAWVKTPKNERTSLSINS